MREFLQITGDLTACFIAAVFGLAVYACILIVNALPIIIPIILILVVYKGCIE
jgi:hypothetical protein